MNVIFLYTFLCVKVKDSLVRISLLPLSVCGFYASAPVTAVARGVIIVVYPAVSHSVRPTLVNMISQECLQGIFFQILAQTFTWTQVVS